MKKIKEKNNLNFLFYFSTALIGALSLFLLIITNNVEMNLKNLVLTNLILLFLILSGIVLGSSNAGK